MVTVTKLAHVGFRAQNLSTHGEFYNDRWGLERIDEYAGEMFFRADGPIITYSRCMPRRHRGCTISHSGSLRRKTRDRTALESFYRDVLGFKLTDQLAAFMTFYRCNANHHSLAFIGARDGVPGFNHAAFEIRDARPPGAYRSVK